MVIPLLANQNVTPMLSVVGLHLKFPMKSSTFRKPNGQ